MTTETPGAPREMIPQWFKDLCLRILAPLIAVFKHYNLDPNLLTLLSLGFSMVSAFVLAAGNLRLGGILVLVSGTFDILDGAVARATNRVSKFGALFDSSLDRYAELVVYFGIASYYFQQGYDYRDGIFIIIALATAGSLMVSYVRARAEGLGFECKVGMMQRPERIVLLGSGAIIHPAVLGSFLFLIAVLANLTAVQRLRHICKISQNTGA